ncbi:helix-turn-helix transcriptional regulator [Alicyclobacillus fastidiosus]|uniref:Helix-turn-helix transcriptional regulator n=1 Tax=Alicyclobacillus fastidiosus TaxID=392011 RepID=A0ABY6ZB28_9BACL|nr:helix-turn-helix domain-containing protein [Alicyclobacillus fastidiosus]WAH39940.1 helix-turn-helix transcriptional regulator [Alicyclobacillus fastidiosus]
MTMERAEANRVSSVETVPCSIEKALDVIGGKWSFLVLKELYDGTRRFSELQRSVIEASPKALTNTLRHLEQRGVISRRVFPTVPVTVEYSLTEKGVAFHSVLHEMKRWGAEWC